MNVPSKVSNKQNPARIENLAIDKQEVCLLAFYGMRMATLDS